MQKDLSVCLSVAAWCILCLGRLGHIFQWHISKGEGNQKECHTVGVVSRHSEQWKSPVIQNKSVVVAVVREWED